jgi:hypothetical protein
MQIKYVHPSNASVFVKITEIGEAELSENCYTHVGVQGVNIL